MKKFVYCLLSVLLVFGGLMLSACEKKVSLNVSVQEITIYTNDPDAEFYGKANVEVTLDNASGAYVEVVDGQDCIHADRRTTYSYGNVHTFTITADKSGQARVKVSAIEDIKQTTEIVVNVNTLTEAIEINQATASQKDHLFVVKGVEKKLDALEYFSFKPVTANMTDVVWTFEDSNSSSLQDNGRVVAKIENNKLYIENESALKTVTLRASFALDKSVYNVVKFDVLENASFESLEIFNQPNDNGIYELKRNDAYRSALQGQLVVNSVYDISLTPQVFLKRNGNLQLLENFNDYFIFDITGVTKQSGQIVYDFSVDAQDDSAKNVFGDFVLKFNVAYKEYAYDITPKDFQVDLQTAYAATGMEILNSTGEIYNNAQIDVYSSYTNGYGLYLKPIVNPTDVALDFDDFYLSIDVNTIEGVNSAADVASYLKVFYRGDELKFSAESGRIYRTALLQSGSEIYVAASDRLENMLSNVQLNFVPYSDGTKGTSVILNLYKIGSGAKLNVLEDGKEIENKYISSTAGSSREVTYNLRVEDITLLSGLSLVTDGNERFAFSALKQVGGGDNYIDVQFTVTLNGTDFESTTSFYFEHVTGKKSETFNLSAFVPMSEASIKSGNTGSANVYRADMQSQNFVEVEGTVVEGTLASESLSHLLMEAGSTLPLITTYQSLSQNGVVFKYLSLEDLAKAGAGTEGANDIFAYDNFAELAKYYGSFAAAPAGLVLSQNAITLPDAQFKGFVCAIFSGYDLSHNETTFVRFFALESFYSVNYLSSNVKQKLLYTQETLSQSEISRSYVDVSVSMRADGKVPTYSNDLSMFSFTSAQDGAFAYNQAEGKYFNNHYTISDVAFTYGGRYLRFRITAISTNFVPSWQDTLTITFADPNGPQQSTQILLEIKNVERVQGVRWISATENNEIYLNLTSQNASERQATITTAISPVEANDKSLTYAYFALSGSASSLDVQTNEIGQTFNLTIGNTTRGGAGWLYLLPSDMVKLVNGKSQVLVYRYRNGDHYADYVELEKLNQVYDQITTVKETYQNDEIVGYFFNNSGEKVNNADVIVKIRITIADGLSEDTAIRIYSADDLRRMDTAKYYQVVNNLEIENWNTFAEFSGMLFGANELITLNFAGNSGIFVENNKGTIKNLAFAGNVTSNLSTVGFVAGKNNGSIENVFVDVAQSKQQFLPSSIVANSQNCVVGGIAGQNDGKILNSFVYGANIDATGATGTVQVGGIAGQNSGSIVDCGVEFYTFVKTENGTKINYTNAFKAASGANIGGIVGLAKSGSIIEKSYVYAYPLAAGTNYTTIKVLDNGTSGKIGLFMALNENNVSIKESFAFVGDLSAPTNAVNDAGSDRVSYQNSYFTYRSGFVDEKPSFTTTIYNGLNSYEVSASNAPQEGSSYANISNTNAYKALSADIWELGSVDAAGIWTKGDIDDDVNFGYLHLKKVTQSSQVDLNSVAFKDVPDKAVAVNDTRAILFKYDLLSSASDNADQNALDRKNTIYLTELFGISARQARSLVLTSQSTDITTDATSIKVNYAGYTQLDVTLRSKIDFTQEANLKVLVINNLPTLSTTAYGQEVFDGETLALQTGKNLDIVHNTSGTIYLNTHAYQTKRNGTVAVAFNADGKGSFTATPNGTSVQLKGEAASGQNYGTITTYLTDTQLSALDQAALKDVQSRNFNVFVYDGANKLEIVNTNKLTFKTSEYAVIDVLLNTDNAADDLVFGLSYNGSTFTGQRSAAATTFKIDEDLTLNVSWTQRGDRDENGNVNYRVVAQVNSATRHKVTEDYNNITLFVNAQSQASNNSLEKAVVLNVKAQDVEKISILTYSVASRIYQGSTLFFRPSNNLISTLSPASEAVLAVQISPSFANITSFDLTYAATPVGLGSVVISRLAYNANYGYYLSSANTTVLSNGVRVNLTETDKTGEGVYYFRIYATSQFSYNSSLKFNVKAYNGDIEVKDVSANLGINYMQEAEIKINGASTILLARGDTAKVTVTLGLNQRLYALYLRGAGTNIDLSTYSEEVTESTRIYTAYVTAYVNATTTQPNGEFYVCADVERVINGIQEIKSSRVTVNLVDFSLDAQNIALTNNNKKQVYNGVEYDVFTSYVGARDTLSFNYPLLPVEYNYNPADPDEALAVQNLEKVRREFLANKNHKDDKLGYYINYTYNTTSGMHEALSLKQQLAYVSDNMVANEIYNANYNTIRQNDNFGIEETGSNNLVILGKKTGRQLMRLTTTVEYQNLTFKYEYYFLIVVDIWSDEETPTQITTGQEFVDFATTSEEADDYILMNDIVLEDYIPVSTELIKSLDGNGYTIHLNSFNIPESGDLNLALFNVVNENTTLKNVRVNIYGAGTIAVDVTAHPVSNIAGFAIENNGVIYNCEVVSYRGDQAENKTVHGLNVTYTIGQNTKAESLTQNQIEQYNVESNVAGFVIENNASIVSSRVGGESFKFAGLVAGENYIQTQQLEVFTISGQDKVAGFVGLNSGTISASFAKNVHIYNNTDSTLSLTAGFALTNSKNIQTSFVEGKFIEGTGEGADQICATGTHITTIGRVGGFVHTNSGLAKNCYANIAIENSKSKPAFVGGFVYQNQAGGEISLCFSACDISLADINQMPFSGVDEKTNSLNLGTITNSYFYSDTTFDRSNQTKLTTGVTIASLDKLKQEAEDSLYGFSFASDSEAYDGIWKTTNHGVTLVAANQIAFSNRYAVTNGNLTSIFYNRFMIDQQTFRTMDVSYGSIYNPFIIRSAYDFAVSTGNATNKEISYYKEYYSNDAVWGSYRIVNDIDMSEIDQDVADSTNKVRLTTYEKQFTGLLEGNGFTISNLSISSSNQAYKSFGLFSTLDAAVIMNVDMVVGDINNVQAKVVGTLAGVAVDSRIIGISITPTQSSQNKTSILGSNITGGVVGMLFGQSVMVDINASSMDVRSSYNGGKKDVTSNAENTDKLRSIISTGGNIYDVVSNLSYAGAVVGYLDVYENANEYVKFANTLQVSDYNIINVHVQGNVSIYGEVAGGLFGYVGNGTYIYDATLMVDDPSYIISKNLYAGGLAGESYGGLFAVSASYNGSSTVDEIEENEHDYYNGSISALRGQMDIFSHKFNQNDAPLYVGGLVGNMGGGYIYIGYSKLNVVSNTSRAVGGLVGVATYTLAPYQLSYAEQSPTINILLNDVYASGDLYNLYKDETDENNVIKGVSGGLVGEIHATDGSAPVLALKNALAMNYYSYQNQNNEIGLVGDENKTTKDVSTITSDTHFTVVGKYSENAPFSTALYVINSINDTYNLATNVATADRIGSNTVGGYNEVLVGGQNHIKLQPFGFNTSWLTVIDNQNVVETTNTDLENYLLQAKPMGGNVYETMQSGYIQNDSIFGKNGWSQIYWGHTKDHLYPHIQLIPRDAMLYWDADNTEEVLKAIKDNSNITIVVRGRTYKDVDGQYSDIDLRDNKKFQELYNGNEQGIKDFGGTLISYNSYYDTHGEGVVNTISSTAGVGGIMGAEAGLVLNGSLFNTLATGARIEGLNLYLTPSPVDRNDENSASKAEVDYSVVNGIAERAIFRDNNIVLNNSVNLDAEEMEGRVVAGIIVPQAKSTSFVDNVFTLRNGGEINLNAADADKGEETYLGVMVGYDQHTEKFTSMLVEGMDIKMVNNRDEATNQNVNINFNINSGNKTYCGMYAGAITKPDVGTRVIVGVSTLDHVVINVNNKTEGKQETSQPAGQADSQVGLYVGAFVGSVSGVTEVTLQSPIGQADGNGVVIYLNASTSKLYAGLAFGEIQSNVNVANDALNTTALKGAIYQGANTTIKDAQVGGIAGRLVGGMNVSSFMIDFTVAKVAGVTTENGKDKFDLPEYTKGQDPNITNIFDENAESYELSPFTTSTSSADTAFGGLVGYSYGGTVTVNGAVTVGGTLDLATDLSLQRNSDQGLSAGGLFGKLSGGYNFVGTLTNNFNISVKGDWQKDNLQGAANVGGMIGWLNNAQDTLVKDEIKINGNANIAGNVLANIKNLTFGGAIGLVNMDSNDVTNISGITYGGAVKVYGDSVAGGAVTVGGVVGSLTGAKNKAVNEQKYSGATISNCKTYGDMFVIYNDKTTDKNGTEIDADNQLSTYNFGGIVGSGIYMHVENCASIMTSFNSRYTSTGTAISYQVGAIVGANHDKNTYSDNKYSSGVCMAYQQDAGNTDCAYGAVDEYLGYSVYTGNREEDKKIDEDFNKDGTEYTNKVKSTSNILGKFTEFTTNTTAEGHKLKPYTNIGNSAFDVDTVKGEYHHIKWVALTSGKTLIYDDDTSDNESSNINGDQNKTFVQNLANAVLVGNGQTVKITDNRTVTGQNLGAITNQIGKDNGGEGISTEFSAITSLLVDLTVSADIKAVDETIDPNTKIPKNALAYGGVAGTTYGNAFIYGVGVQGDISVGEGERSESEIKNKLQLGGIVGNMCGGMINECYSAANITYRAAEGGIVAGIANLGLAKNAIKATYSSGLVQTYVNVPIYTFASVNTNSKTEDNVTTYSISNVIDIVDCYSVASTARNIQLINTDKDFKVASADCGVFFINKKIDESGNDKTVVIPEKLHLRGEVFNGSEYTEDSSSNAEKLNFTYKEGSNDKKRDASTMALGYDKPAIKNYTFKVVEEETNSTNTQWYFSPYTNHGYATHGFGYLKNVTTYTREKKANVKATGDETKDSALPINEYIYTRVAYTDILKNAGNSLQFTVGTTDEDKIANANNIWFMGVQNVGKFNQMVEAVKQEKEANGTTDKPTNKVYRFKLDQDINMQKASGLGTSIGRELNKNQQSGAQTQAEGTEITNTFENLIFDGANHTLDFSFSKDGYVLDYKDGSTTETTINKSTTVRRVGSSIFGDVMGDMENLRIADINIYTTNVDISKHPRGTLAASVTGNLSNITVTGNLQTKYFPPSVTENGTTTYHVEAIGGVVGQVTGNVIGVEAMVNINSTSSGVIGGVVGQLTHSKNATQDSNGVWSDGKISYSSNAGQIVSVGSKDEYQPEVLRFTPVGTDGQSAYTGREVGDVVLTANTVVGGVVGYAYGATIDKCYNANAALSGYTAVDPNGQIGSVTNHNYFAGGIVGFADGVSITNSVNVGLVGAGNYGVEKKYAYAGGIFAYGTNLKEVSGCINDAKVEAITYVAVPDANDLSDTAFTEDYDFGPESYKINGQDVKGYKDGILGNVYCSGKSATLKDDKTDALKIHISPSYIGSSYNWNHENTTSYENDGYHIINSINYDITLIYNPNQNRRVNAYGIGFVGNNYDATKASTDEGYWKSASSPQSAVENGNYSSTDNIVNDGCIGEVKETRSVTFERGKILDNGSGDGLVHYVESIWGKFTMQSVANSEENPTSWTNILHESGYDSYGFISRLYKVDQISRIYADKVDTDNKGNIIELKNPIVERFLEYVGGTIGKNQAQPYYMGQFNWNGDYWEQDRANEGARYCYDLLNQGSVWNKFYYGEENPDGFRKDHPLGYGKGGKTAENIIKQWNKDPYDYLVDKNKVSLKQFLEAVAGWGNHQQVFTLEDLAMKQDTDYYVSCSFSGYDVILKGGEIVDAITNKQKREDADKIALQKALQKEKGNREFGLFAFDLNLSATNKAIEQKDEKTANELQSEANKNIEEIDATLENVDNVQTITINGQKTAVVHSANDVLSVVAPYVYEGQIVVEKNVAKDEKLNSASISNVRITNVTISGDYNNNSVSNDSVQYFKEISRSGDNDETAKEITIKFAAYSSKYYDSPELNVDYQYTYTSTVELVGTNVVDDNCVVLTEPGFSEYEINEFNKNANISDDQAADGARRIKTVYIADRDADGNDSNIYTFTKPYKLNYGKLKADGDDVAWIEIDDAEKDKIVNGRYLVFETQVFNKFTVQVELASQQMDPAEITVPENNEEKIELDGTYKNFKQSDAYNLSFADVDGGKSAELSIPSEPLAFANDAFAGAYVAYDGTTWQVKSNDVITLTLDAGTNTLVVTAANSTDVDNFTSGIKAYVKADIYMVTEFYPLEGLSQAEESVNDITVTATYGYSKIKDAEGNVVFGLGDGRGEFCLGEQAFVDLKEGGLDGAIKTVETIFGVFRQVTVTYKRDDLKKVELSSKEPVGYKLAYNGKTRYGALGSEDLTLTDVAAGDVIKIDTFVSSAKVVEPNEEGTLVETDKTFDNLNGWIENESAKDNIYSSMNLKGSNDEVEYVVSNGTEGKIEGDLSFISEQKYVETSYSTYLEGAGPDEPAIPYAITFKVYENGAYSVAYTFIVESTDDEGNAITSIDTDKSVMFVYNPTDGNIYRVLLKEITKTVVDEETGVPEEIPTYDWDYQTSTRYTGSDNVFESYNDITVNLIATKILKNKVLFAKNSVGALIVSGVTEKTWQDQDNKVGFEIFEGGKSIFDPTEEYEGTYIEGTLKYWEDMRSDEEKEDPNVAAKFEGDANYGLNIENTSYVKKLYQYQVSLQGQKSPVEVPNPPTEDRAGNTEVANMLFAGDVHLESGVKDNNGVTVLGNGKVVKFVNNGDGGNISLFNTFTGNMSNLNVVGISSLRNTSKKSSDTSLETFTDISAGTTCSLLTISTNGIIENITLFGSVRSISTSDVTVSAMPDNVEHMLNVNSYISMVGLDEEIKSGKNVAAKLNDAALVPQKPNTDANATGEKYQAKSSYTSHNILIAGNGGSGANGYDGNKYSYNGCVGSGISGSSGGSGGNVCVVSDFAGYVRAGIAGLGGYGGNGANGYFYNNQMYGGGWTSSGGAAGQAGATGNNGQVILADETSIAVADETSSTIEELSNRADKVTDIKLYSGNGGIGGFGRIVNNNGSAIYYTRGFANGTGHTGNDVYIDIKTQPGFGYINKYDYCDNYALGLVGQLTFVNENDALYPGKNGDFDDDNRENQWYENIAGRNRSDWGVNRDIGTWEKTYNKDNKYEIEKLNVLVKTAMDQHSSNKMKRAKKLVWSDGRDINYGGEFDKANSTNTPKTIKLTHDKKDIFSVKVMYKTELEQLDKDILDNLKTLNIEYFKNSEGDSDEVKDLKTKVLDILKKANLTSYTEVDGLKVWTIGGEDCTFTGWVDEKDTLVYNSNGAITDYGKKLGISDDNWALRNDLTLKATFKKFDPDAYYVGCLKSEWILNSVGIDKVYQYRIVDENGKPGEWKNVSEGKGLIEDNGMPNVYMLLRHRLNVYLKYGSNKLYAKIDGEFKQIELKLVMSNSDTFGIYTKFFIKTDILANCEVENGEYVVKELKPDITFYSSSKFTDDSGKLLGTPENPNEIFKIQPNIVFKYNYN